MAAVTKPLTKAQREQREKAAARRHSLDTYIDSIVRRAPELTPEQVAKLRPLLVGAVAE